MAIRLVPVGYKFTHRLTSQLTHKPEIHVYTDLSIAEVGNLDSHIRLCNTGVTHRSEEADYSVLHTSKWELHMYCRHLCGMLGFDVILVIMESFVPLHRCWGPISAFEACTVYFWAQLQSWLKKCWHQQMLLSGFALSKKCHVPSLTTFVAVVTVVCCYPPRAIWVIMYLVETLWWQIPAGAHVTDKIPDQWNVRSNRSAVCAQVIFQVYKGRGLLFPFHAQYILLNWLLYIEQYILLNVEKEYVFFSEVGCSALNMGYTNTCMRHFYCPSLDVLEC